MFHDILIKHTHHLPRFVPWTIEVSTLKHELWQTIQAHNHNADLLKHHKDAIDQAWLCLVGDLAYFPNGKSIMTGESIGKSKQVQVRMTDSWQKKISGDLEGAIFLEGAGGRSISRMKNG
jgi:hypothetical protein